jgi:hypothetical protein
MTGAMIARRPPAVLEVGCPHCGADPATFCRDHDGRVRYLDHLARIYVAALVQVHDSAAVLSTVAHIGASGHAL